MSEEKLKTKDYLVAYIDILGATKMMKPDSQDEYLNRIKDVYEHVLSKFKTSGCLSDSIKINIFSDNILLAAELVSGGKYAIDPLISNFLSFVSFFQLSALGSGFILRGGVVKGKLHIDNNFAWGSALVNAYELEHKKSLYPRILIDKSVDFIDLKLPDDFNYSWNIVADKDGCLFLDYLFVADFLKIKSGHKLIEHLKTNLKIELKNNEGDANIMQKLLWQKDYFNSFCAKNELEKYTVK